MDDERFFESVIKPVFKKNYDYIEVRKYAQKTKKYIFNLLKTIKSMKNSYIYFSDINDTPCITLKKQEILKIYKNIDEDRIVVVIKEIESWYLAGLDDATCRGFGITGFDNTDDITKGRFKSLWRRSERFDSEIDFIQEILKYFDIETAKRKNKSFRYFVEKYDP